MVTRNDILDKAKAATADRESSYGSPRENFDNIAQLWNVILGKKTLKEPLSCADVAMMMVALKLARLMNEPDHEDSQVDICGYAALMSEVV